FQASVHLHTLAASLVALVTPRTPQRSVWCDGSPFLFPRAEIRSCIGGVGVLCATPYAATHVPLALVVTQRRQAFWQSLWSLVRSTVSSTHVPPPYSGGRTAKGGPV